MAYIGNTVENQGFTPAIDYFNGNGVTVTFTLSRPIASVAQVIVAIDNVIQNPSSSFTIAGNAITFSSAPLSGTNNIWVEYTSLITTYQAISQDPTVIGDIRATGGYLAEGDFGNSFVDGAILDYVTGRGRVTVGDLDDITFYHGGTAGRSAMMDLYYAGGAKVYGTTALTIPVGTTAQRPTGANGMIRYNTTLGVLEGYINGAWTTVKDSSYSVEYLVIAGGAGGGAQHGGGGGSGGYRSSVIGESFQEPVLNIFPGTSYTVTVGAGGAGGTSGQPGTNGNNSVFGSITSVGGGGGGGWGVSPFGGLNGGSGGGASLTGVGGNATAGQGFNGGDTGPQGINSTFPNGGSGGGGANNIGESSQSLSKAGNGGNGLSSSITGTSVTRAGGGGGGSHSPYAIGIGGSGGGGNGGLGNNGAPSGTGGDGTVNTGSGGGGSGSNSANGGAGGSGVVIIRYSGAQRGTGGTVTSSGGYTIHTFTSSGTYTA